MRPKRKTSQPPPAAVPNVLADAAVFDAALHALATLDPAFAAKLRDAGAAPTLRRREAGFEGLASIIVAQQVSTASANAIFGRFKESFGGAPQAAAILAAPDEQLRLCGLSAPKMRTLRAIAAAIEEGTLAFDALADMEAEAAHAALVAVKGIGPWTADVFLLFCLGHADAWPAGDLALQEAARDALDLPARPSTTELIALGERWRPLRGVAAHCLWAYYGAARGRAATLETADAGLAKPRSTTPRSAGRKRKA